MNSVYAHSNVTFFISIYIGREVYKKLYVYKMFRKTHTRCSYYWEQNNHLIFIYFGTNWVYATDLSGVIFLSKKANFERIINVLISLIVNKLLKGRISQIFISEYWKTITHYLDRTLIWLLDEWYQWHIHCEKENNWSKTIDCIIYTLESKISSLFQ